jgi:peptide deformylase
VQHELDHLDGRLLVDRMSVVQRMSQRRRLRELEDRFEQRKDQADTKAAH